MTQKLWGVCKASSMNLGDGSLSCSFRYWKSWVLNSTVIFLMNGLNPFITHCKPHLWKLHNYVAKILYIFLCILFGFLKARHCNMEKIAAIYILSPPILFSFSSLDSDCSSDVEMSTSHSCAFWMEGVLMVGYNVHYGSHVHYGPLVLIPHGGSTWSLWSS